ncbi:MAG: SGNH/GDSL hydrolase family protein [Leptolyngbyaceae cyanobacterium bins.59]|nr:SGNH/GDSL hydrolase family protein [Leptolyngbyaceae cyanobacterium bins.59]
MLELALIVLAIALVGLGALEIGLRWRFGFGNPLVYIPDEQIGYLLAPNQRTHRVGNLIEINQYSMRSPEPLCDRPDGAVRILLLGDSVANGGWWTDQKDIISEILRGLLDASPASGSVEVLNASANSWGPRNELAYLERFGTFESQVVVLVINTDDLFAIAPSSLPVGRDPNYPDRKPPLAIAELLQRYWLRPALPPEVAKLQEEQGDRVGANLEAILKIGDRVNAQRGRFLLIMTPLLREVSASGPRDYEIKARQRLVEFTEEYRISYIDFLPIFKSAEEPSALYRDHIHLSPKGNRLVSETIGQVLQTKLEVSKD